MMKSHSISVLRIEATTGNPLTAPRASCSASSPSVHSTKNFSLSPVTKRKLFFAARTVHSLDTVLKHSASMDTMRYTKDCFISV